MTAEVDCRVGAADRRTDIDLLRVVFCGAVILQHALLIFAAEPRYHVKSAASWAIASTLNEFLHFTVMPGFFLLAGWSAVVSLRHRRPGQFLGERVRRVFVPLVAGVVFLGPIIKYVELCNGRDMGLGGFRLAPPPEMGFLAFLPHYFGRLNLVTWSHLWFLAYLFLISVLFLPILAPLARRSASPAIPPAWVVWLPALAIAGLLAGLRGYWPFLPNLIADWANFAFFGLCFLIGAMMAAWPGFERRTRAQTAPLALLGLGGSAGLALWGEPSLLPFFVAAAAWGVSAAALGLASRHAPPPSPVMRYLAEATLPVYVLHHVPVLLIGMAVLRLDLPAGVLALLIWLMATASTLAIYHWLVRPFAPTRFLLGMAARPPAAGPLDAGPSRAKRSDPKIEAIAD
jgi:peptidoglycan/LPS O-acetylase OafA/YrhL